MAGKTMQYGFIDETAYLAFEGQGFDPVSEEEAKSIEEQKKKEKEEE